MILRFIFQLLKSLLPVIGLLCFSACEFLQKESSSVAPPVPRDGYLQNFQLSKIGRVNQAIRGKVQADDAVRWEWKKLSGPGNVVFSDPYSATPWITADLDGHYEIMVTAFDAEGHMLSSFTHMEWDSTPPLIELSAAFQAFSSFQPMPLVRDAATYHWSQLSGPASLRFSNAESLETFVEATADGVYTFVLVARDELGNESRSESRLLWNQTRPVVDVGPDIFARQTHLLRASTMDVSRLQWDMLSGPGNLVFSAADQAETQVSADQDGVYTIRLTAFNSAGLAVSDVMQFTWDQTAPRIEVKQPGNIGGLVWKPTITTDEKVDLSWSKLNGPGAIKFSNELLSTIEVDEAGDYELQLEATDRAGNLHAQQIKVSFIKELRIKEISLGSHASRVCVIDIFDELRCWGAGLDSDYPDFPQYSSLARARRSTIPAVAIDLGKGRKPRKVVTSGQHTCALLDDKSVKCWGDNFQGQLGIGFISSSRVRTPQSLAWPKEKTFKDIAVGKSHTCGILEQDQSVHCWGSNSKGQLGLGDSSLESLDAPSERAVVFPGGHKAVSLALGLQVSCALLDNEQVTCWGDSDYVGYASADKKVWKPEQNIDFASLSKVEQLSVGSTHACALLKDKSVACWGKLYLGSQQSDHDSLSLQLIPLNVDSMTDVASVAAGSAHTCVRYQNGRGACWGLRSPSLGYGKDVNDSIAPPAEGIDFKTQRALRQLVSGRDLSCAIFDDQSLSCWGYLSSGALGFSNKAIFGFPEAEDLWQPIPWAIDYSGHPTLVR